jgi:hypothetical protein
MRQLAISRYFVLVDAPVTTTWELPRDFRLVVNRNDGTTNVPIRFEIHGDISAKGKLIVKLPVSPDQFPIVYEVLLGDVAADGLDPTKGMLDPAEEFPDRDLIAKSVVGAATFVRDPENPWPTPGGQSIRRIGP